ncbi:MAG: hypothetical protein J0G95_07240 [Rhizobiales bacterium]|nr:hypothetical protein [Hyphomicrobiales bacterium]
MDYHVGVPEGLALKNPATISMAGVTVNTTTKVITVTGNNVTLDGYDFSLNGGWQVSVQAANTTITNSNFLIGSNNLAPIISTAAASNMTVSYCTIDGAGKDPGWGGLISYRGNGFTVEDSWLKNAGGDMIQQIDGGANSTVVIQNNLIQNGGMASGAHGDYTQLAGGPFNVSINYNTTIQKGGTTQGLMTEYVAGGEIGHNTMIGSASYFVSVDNSSIKTTVTVHDNYYDPQGFGFVYPNSGPDDGSAKSIYIHNVNMKTGAVLQDSNAPVAPPVQAPAPGAPTIASFSNDSGVVGDGITNDNTLTLTGTAAANGTVKVFDGATQIGTATANASGAWSFTTSALADGAHNLTAKVTDASGQTSAASAVLAVKIDTVAPAAPIEVGDSVVNGNQVLLNGTAEANSTVKVYDGLTLVGTTTTKADGTWSVTTSALSAGSHDLFATATDVAGNTSAKSLPLDPIINGPAPGAPTIASFSNDTGVVGDHITSDNTLTLTGTAAANGTVKVFDGATQIGTATANASGAWSFTTAALADGAHNLTAKVTNASGQSSAASATLAVKIDTAAPNAPTVAAPTGNTNGSVNLTGTAEAGSTVQVFDGKTQIGTATANSSGAWSLTTGALTSGNHTLTAKATDAAGNTSAASAGVVANIPSATPAPSAPKISSFSNDTGVAGDNITSDNTLTLKGTAAANSTVKVFDGATQIGTATANSSGAWSYTTAKLADGAHNLTAKATDASGQTSAASAVLAVKIDTAAPVAPTMTSTTAGTTAKGGTVTLTGTAEANSTVQVFDGKTQIGTATANSNGAWSLTTGTLTTGNHALTAKATDAAGNTSVASAGLKVNVPSTRPSAPDAPKISSFSNDTGVAGDNITSDNTLTLKGTAAANSTVKVFDGATQIGTAAVNSSGAWSFTTAKLADGAHNLAAKVTNASGQTSAASAVLAVKIDTHAPTAPKIASGDGAANADHVTLAGTAEANSTVHVFDGTKQIGTATANEKGAWTYVADSLSDGSHSFTTKAMDAAGNTSGSSAAFDVKIDTHVATPAPSAAFTNVVQNWNDTVTFKGTADPHSQISIYDNGHAKPIGSVKVGSDGNWSYKTSSAVSDGVHNFTATVTDKAGNTGSLPGNAVLGTNCNDVLKGTSGNDFFKGNGGQDTFVFTSNFGADIIKDFNAIGRNHDVVQFSKSVFDSFADVLAHAAQNGHDVLIDAGGGNTLTLKDTKLAALDKTDFHFV